jgi:hypothetical protein
VELIDFVYDWVHWLILKNTEMNIRVPWKAGSFLTSLRSIVSYDLMW